MIKRTALAASIPHPCCPNVAPLAFRFSLAVVFSLFDYNFDNSLDSYEVQKMLQLIRPSIVSHCVLGQALLPFSRTIHGFSDARMHCIFGYYLL